MLFIGTVPSIAAVSSCTPDALVRDIKGANILATKEGLVKLADFGVATKINDSQKSDSVVGTVMSCTGVSFQSLIPVSL